MSCLRYRLFLPSKPFILLAISNEKTISFKPLCSNVKENCDVDVAIDCAGYQSIKQYEKKLPARYKVEMLKFARRTCAQNSLSTKLISQKLIWWPNFLMQKMLNGKNGMHVRNSKKTVEWTISNLEMSIFLFHLVEIYSRELCLYFPVSSSVCKKKILIKNMGSLA